MASSHPHSPRNEEEEVEEELLLKMEQDVEQLADKSLHYRTTLPDHLTSTLSTILASQRPHLLSQSHTPAAAGGSTNPPISDNAEEAEKIRLLKQKISSNALELPVVLSRMEQCMERIDKLEPSDKIIHPAFEMKKTG